MCKQGSGTEQLKNDDALWSGLGGSSAGSEKNAGWSGASAPGRKRAGSGVHAGRGMSFYTEHSTIEVQTQRMSITCLETLRNV